MDWIALGIVLIVFTFVYVAAKRYYKGREGRQIPDVPLELLIDPSASQDRLNPRPRAPEQTADVCWVPPGRAATVQGFTLPLGMVYVGAGLYRDRRAWKPEDCLIDPTLRVNRDAPDHEGRTVPYWPSYNKLTPNARAAYLAWLSGGAQAPEAPAGYVMLYFYGLQRRLLKDEPDAVEQVALLEETRRLHSLYRHHPFFDKLCTALFETLQAGKLEKP